MISIMSNAVDLLFRDANRRPYPQNSSVFCAGDRVHLVYLVLEGSVDLVRYSNSGNRLILNRSYAGDILAEASVYTPTYHCDGEVAEPAILAHIEVRTFLSRMDENPACARNWAAKLAQQLQAARLQSELRALRTVSERLDMWLSANHELPRKGQMQDVAHILGVSREALYRELAKRR